MRVDLQHGPLQLGVGVLETVVDDDQVEVAGTLQSVLAVLLGTHQSLLHTGLCLRAPAPESGLEHLHGWHRDEDVEAVQS